jgi:hypothetical protein
VPQYVLRYALEDERNLAVLIGGLATYARLGGRGGSGTVSGAVLR